MRLLFPLALVMASILAVPQLHAETPARLDIIHGWKAEVEQHALDVFRSAVIAQGVQWSEGASEQDRNGVEAYIIRKVDAGLPIGAVQWLGAMTSLKQLQTQAVLRPVNDIADDHVGKLIPEVQDIVIDDGNMLSLPLGIHTYNFMVYNHKLLHQLGLPIPQSWDEFAALGPILQKQGVYLLATSDQFWQLRTMLRSIASSYLTREQFIALVDESDNLDVAELQASMQKILQLILDIRPFANNDPGDLSWEKAADMVIEGKALSQILGDYIVPHYRDQVDITCSITPQTRFMYWGMDTFVLVNSENPAEIAGQKALVKSVLNENNAREYLYRKGGLPVLSTIDASSLDACNRQTLNVWNATDHLFVGNYLSKKRYTAFFGLLVDYWLNQQPLEPKEAAILMTDVLTSM